MRQESGVRPRFFRRVKQDACLSWRTRDVLLILKRDGVWLIVGRGVLVWGSGILTSGIVFLVLGILSTTIIIFQADTRGRREQKNAEVVLPQLVLITSER